MDDNDSLKGLCVYSLKHALRRSAYKPFQDFLIFDSKIRERESDVDEFCGGHDLSLSLSLSVSLSLAIFDLRRFSYDL